MKLTYSALTVLSLMLCSCSNTIYIPFLPDKVNSPGFSERNEAKVDASISPYNKVSVDAAWAPVRHIGVIASYRNLYYERHGETKWDGQISDWYNTKVECNRVDLGVGYFAGFDEKGRFEVYGGLGIGNMNAYHIAEYYNPYSKTEYILTSKIQRYFIQAGAGVEGKIFSFMSGLRFCYQGHSDINLSSNSSSVPRIVIDGPYHIQPYCDFRIGYKFIKFTTQIGWGNSTSASEVRNTNLVRTTESAIPSPFISAGLVFHFSPEYLRR